MINLSILLSLIVVSSCALFGIKKTPSKDILQSANQALSSCEKSSQDINSCNDYLLFLREYDLGFKNKQEENLSQSRILNRLCLVMNSYKHCSLASDVSYTLGETENTKNICLKTKKNNECFNYYKILNHDSLPNQNEINLALEYSCKDGSKLACAKIQENSIALNSDIILKKICNENGARGCLHLGYYQRHFGFDPRLREPLYSKACNLGLSEACEASKTMPLAINLYDCENGKTNSCIELTDSYFRRNDFHTALKYAEKGCSYGCSVSCGKKDRLAARIQSDENERIAIIGAVVLGVAVAAAASSGSGSSYSAPKSQNSHQNYYHQSNTQSSNSNLKSNSNFRNVSGSGIINCGLKPLPSLGCRIGRCLSTGWEQICDQNPIMSCGLKPLPNLGCQIGRCVDGVWEQVCNSNPIMSCGLKPLPNLGCRIGRCVDGVWEQVCN